MRGSGPLIGYRAPMRWRMLLPLLATAGLLAALAPVAVAEDAGGPAPAAPAAAAPTSPAATPIMVASVQPARRGPVIQIGPYVPEVPPVPADTGVGRRIVYCNSCQYVWVIDEHDKVIRSYSVSGRQYMPGPGVYHIFVKQRNTFATHNPSIIWEYMVTFTYGPNGGGIGFHEIPWQYGAPVQTEAQLGQFLSGGCVRQKHDDAVFMWDWSQIGDTVVVTA
jgi:lipoprotein-anchoring transpeptidase ErfK/SrfK